MSKVEESEREHTRVQERGQRAATERLVAHMTALSPFRLIRTGVDEVRQLKKAKGYTMRTADQQHAVGLVFPADSTGLA